MRSAQMAVGFAMNRVKVKALKAKPGHVQRELHRAEERVREAGGGEECTRLQVASSGDVCGRR